MNSGGSIQRFRRLSGEIWADLRGGLSAETIAVFLLAPILLTLDRYFAKPRVFRALAVGWRADPFFDLYAFAWWYLGAALLLMVVPLVLWRAWFRRTLRELGLQWGDRSVIRPLLVAFGVMGVVVIAVGFSPGFAEKYPLSDLARERADAFILYELLYGLYFFAWEFFFRGWMLRTLARDFGTGANWIQTLPFVLMHFGKPVPETLGAIPAGLFLGWIAIRADSFLYGWALHWGIAFLLDFSIVARIWWM